MIFCKMRVKYQQLRPRNDTVPEFRRKSVNKILSNRSIHVYPVLQDLMGG